MLLKIQPGQNKYIELKGQCHQIFDGILWSISLGNATGKNII
jgi:hypothetical protein